MSTDRPLKPGECPSKLSFGTSPYLDLRCDKYQDPEAPHSSHRTKTFAPTRPYGVDSRGGTDFGTDRKPVAVFLEWAQDVTPEEVTDERT